MVKGFLERAGGCSKESEQAVEPWPAERTMISVSRKLPASAAKAMSRAVRLVPKRSSTCMLSTPKSSSLAARCGKESCTSSDDSHRHQSRARRISGAYLQPPVTHLALHGCSFTSPEHACHDRAGRSVPRGRGRGALTWRPTL